MQRWLLLIDKIRGPAATAMNNSVTRLEKKMNDVNVVVLFYSLTREMLNAFPETSTSFV
jgi:hypothetical protein